MCVDPDMVGLGRTKMCVDPDMVGLGTDQDVRGP